MKLGRLAVFLLLALALSAAPGAAAPQTILIAAFGTSVGKARGAYTAIEKQLQAAFPDAAIRWAWSARSLLKTASKEKPRLSPQEALAKLAAEGVKEVAVLSLHIVPGGEYSDLERTVRALEGLPKGLKRIRLAPPLLHDTQSLQAAARILFETVPKERRPEDAVIFAGHGTHHSGGMAYPALQYYLSLADTNAFVGTVEGDPDFERVAENLKTGQIRKAWIIPLMTVAGDHARQDMFGSDKDSWKEKLIAQGVEVKTVVRGLGEAPTVVALWIEGLKKALGNAQ